MLNQVTKGSKEELTVLITDKSGSVTDLSAAGPKYEVKEGFDGDVFKRGDGSYANAIAATASAMKISAVVDHKDAGTPWTEGDYRLFVWFVVGTQEIRKGPYHYQVVD